MRKTSLTRPLILASESPRRAKLLAQLGLVHRVMPSQTVEPLPAPGEDVESFVQRAATAKALAVARQLPPSPHLVLAADTIVVLPTSLSDNGPRLHDAPVIVLGKPGTAAEARRMLYLLSGRVHSVVTAIALLNHPDDTTVSDVVETCVRMRQLSAVDIDNYVATGESLDKAGGYGIQGMGAVLVEEITGDYYTVVGLPLARLWQRLRPWMARG